ncbi:hypothetical protein GUITHDRAFT_120666 [Guillardia theta CCMP2712]|uniref:Uncharacterized protein n=1 Tax=Guillardia theta (strain CCMP2712) TaxID=905079 RepID=L1IBC8_GUITC|nr:hypothetical protein GUITHDRAFT_120666 [Guillardia theta CCMP2712]EKX33145.1 hypothetical protein GUITHDRAFT_120666 [Guillardia theta CCMP2712]|eukprot:XP_005820125.1 hypothetical protein GUITHDRAFT_120666 [Guillardia theta CCMP2712]
MTGFDNMLSTQDVLREIMSSGYDVKLENWNTGSHEARETKAPGTPAREDAELLTQAVKSVTAAYMPSQDVSDLYHQHYHTPNQAPRFLEQISISEGAVDSEAHSLLSPQGTSEENSKVEQGALDSSTAFFPTAPQPCLLDAEKQLVADVAALRHEDPRARVVSGPSALSLQPRRDEAIYLFAWGCSHNYQLGTGQYQAQPFPKLVSTLTRLGNGIIDVSYGADHGAAIDSTGKLFTWGLCDHGRLGLKSGKDVPYPTRVDFLKDEVIVDVTCGMYSSACISHDMKVFTWGSGSKGQLGHVEKSDEWLPRSVAALHHIPIVQVALGYEHMAALSLDGDVYTWGEGEHGQLGHGDLNSCSTPKKLLLELENTTGEVADVGSPVLLACGASVTLILTDYGRLISFGMSEFGALGLGEKRLAARPHLITSRIMDKRRFVHLSAGDEHCAAVTSKGNVYTWGQGCFGAVGKPARRAYSNPPDCRKPYKLELPLDKRACATSCGGNYTVILSKDGCVLVLGDDSTEIRPMLYDESNPASVMKASSVLCGRYHSGAILNTLQYEEARRAGAHALGLAAEDVRLSVIAIEMAQRLGVCLADFQRFLRADFELSG